MPRKKTEYPRDIKVGSAVVKIYRVAHAKTKNGVLYTVSFRDARRVRRTKQFADPGEAEAEARLQASKLASGQTEAAGLTKADRDELLALRATCGKTPALVAVREWARACELTGGHVLAAAQAWAEANGKTFTPIVAEDCVEAFIAAKNAAGREGDRVYRSKLAPIKTMFAGRRLHTITTPEWTTYLSQFTNGVTRNDFRKRALTMCRWAQKHRYLPRGGTLEIVETERAVEQGAPIGLATPETIGRLLQHLRLHHPHHLAALVIACFCGLRSDEIHGKREKKKKATDGVLRQTWEDIHLAPPREGNRRTPPYLIVTNAKKNTPSNRHVPLRETAIEWLRLCPEPHEGFVCRRFAMDRIRAIGRAAGLDLPENCFRHSYISYSVELEGNKALVAKHAGTSIQKIDTNYRRPVPIARARAWFAMTPEEAAALPLNAVDSKESGSPT